MSFYFVLSLFPFFLVIAAILGWLPSTNSWHNFAEWITHYLPRAAGRLVFATVIDLSQGSEKFFSVGLLTMLWTASSGFVSLMESLSAAYGVRETRGYLKKRLIATGASVVGAAFAVASFALLAFGHRIAEFIADRFGPVNVPVEFFRWAATVILMVLGLDLMNYFLPDGGRRWRWLTVGTALVTSTIVAFSFGFKFYLRYFNTYPRFYGALAGFIILLIWIYVASLILLVGAVTDHAIEQAKTGGTSA